MLTHNCEALGSQDHVRVVVSSGIAAWTNSELQEVNSEGIATTDTAPIVVVVEVVLDVDVVELLVDVVLVVVLVEVVSVLDVVLVVVVVVVVAVIEVSDVEADAVVMVVVLNVVVVNVTVSVMLSTVGSLRPSTVTVYAAPWLWRLAAVRFCMADAASEAIRAEVMSSLSSPVVPGPPMVVML